MANLSTSVFLGMMPRRGARLLEDAMATYAENARGLSGYLTGRSTEILLATLPAGTNPKRVYRMVNDAGAEKFLTFQTPNVDILRAPQVNDRFNRFYWAGDGIPPSFNTFDRIGNFPAYFLGVPPPETPPILSQVTAGTGSSETRAYVYTYVDEFGQEGPPSGPTLITVLNGAVVEVTATSPPVVPGFATPTTIRIYRTVPGVSSSSYFFVQEIPAAAPVFVDNLNSAQVALNETLSSLSFFPPPTDMKGMVAMPNGFLVGFRGRDLLFSEPYRPHAWPPQYTLSVEDNIVGLGVFDANVAVLTDGTPFLASGVVPEAMSMVRVGPINACTSRRSIVPMAGAVLYASEDGIGSLSAGGQRLLTAELIDRDTWRAFFAPNALVAARDGDSNYIAFGPSGRGFEIDFNDLSRGVFVADPYAIPFGAFDQDAEGRRALYTSGDRIYTYGASGAPSSAFVWRSKEFFMTKPLNFGVAQVNFEGSPNNASSPVHVPDDTLPQRRRLGDATFEPWQSDPTANPDPRLPPTGNPAIEFALIADGVERFRQVVQPNRPFKLPSGYKAQVYQFEISGQARVSRVMIAETERELEAL